METILTVIYFVLIAIEWTIGKFSNKNIYNKRNSIINLLLGAIAVVVSFFCLMIALRMMLYIYPQHSIFKINNSGIWSFVLLFFVVDFGDYWSHRASHKINMLWAAHIVHHQSEHYNLTVGIRASILVPVFNVFLYCLYPLIGFSPEKVLFVLLIQGFYNLIIHTEFIGKLGWLEYILVTPSSHRVHHAKNEKYMDMNFGKMLAIWDLIFGTYIKENEVVEFGVSDTHGGDGVGSSLFYPIRKIMSLLSTEKNRKRRIQILFGSPSTAEKIYQERRKLIPMETDDSHLIDLATIEKANLVLQS